MISAERMWMNGNALFINHYLPHNHRYKATIQHILTAMLPDFCVRMILI